MKTLKWNKKCPIRCNSCLLKREKVSESHVLLDFAGMQKSQNLNIKNKVQKTKQNKNKKTNVAAGASISRKKEWAI